MLIRALVFAALAAAAPPSMVIDDATHPPGGWVVVDPPKDGDWQCANHSSQEWALSSNAGGGIRIAPYEGGGDIRLALPGGELVGANHGEFGGSLAWVNQASVRTVLSTEVNPVAFTRRGDDVFVASGLAHLGLDSGAILRLRRPKGGAWRVERVMDLGEAPNAGVRVDDRTWVILTTGGVTRVDLSSLVQKRIYQNRNWGMLYGNSIRPLGNAWLIGARRAVLRIAPVEHGYMETWLVPASCKRQVGPKCDCEP